LPLPFISTCIGVSLFDPGSSYATERFRYILIKGKLAPKKILRAILNNKYRSFLFV